MFEKNFRDLYENLSNGNVFVLSFYLIFLPIAASK